MTFAHHNLLLLLLLLASGPMSCQQESVGQLLVEVKMLGTFETPEGAEGGHEPISQTYTVTSIVMNTNEGEAIELITDTIDPVTINNRTQLVFQTEVEAEWNALTFNSFVVTFDPTMTATSKLKTDHELTLTAPEAIYATPYTVPTGQGIVLTVKVKWRNTVTRDEDAGTDTMTLPEFDVSYSAS